MKVAYLCGGQIGRNRGVFSKVESQVREWSSSCESYLVAFTERKVINSEGAVVYNEELPSWGGASGGRFLRLLRLYGDYRFIGRAVKLISPDVCYSRYMLPLFFPWGQVAACSRAFVFEINSDDIFEYNRNSKIVGFLNNLFRKRFLKKSDGFVYVSKELMGLQSFCFLRDKPARVIGNGIEFLDLGLGSSTVLEDAGCRISCVFVGSPNQPWHGVEKIISFAKECPEFDFKIIGIDDLDCQESNIFSYGYVSVDKAIEIILTCEVGISSLSLYEVGLHEASPLKSRQYFMCGLPVIGCYADTDIEPGRYYLKIPNTPDNVFSSHDLIVDFIKRSGDHELREEIRAFAKEKLSFSVKESERLAFFRDLVQND